MPQRVGDTRTIKEARKTLSGGHIYRSVISVDAQPCPLSHRAAHVDISWLDCRR
jgi:hypothetical protein